MNASLFLIIVSTLHLTTSVPYYYRPLAAEQVSHLASWSPNDKHPMWELSGQFEGDMVFMPEQRNGLIKTKYRWPNKEIPYEFSDDFNEQEKQYISQTLEKEYAKTCIKIRPKTSNDKDYVYITGKDNGCWSYVGRIGGRQRLNLQRYGCVFPGTIAHEFLHVTGFHHQQSATDRDNYVTIIWENITEKYKRAFKKYKKNVITSFGEKYDYESVMHYTAYAFSKNGERTIVPKDPNVIIGNSNRLSPTDINKLNKMYECV